MKLTKTFSSLPGFAIAFCGDTENPYIFLEPYDSISYDETIPKEVNDQNLDSWLQTIRSEIEHTDIPMVFGYISYEYGYRLEPSIQRTEVSPTSIPDYFFYAYRTVIDCKKNTVHKLSTRNPYWKIDDNESIEVLKEWSSSQKNQHNQTTHNFETPLVEESICDSYMRGVTEIKEKILDGYVYQVNLSLQIEKFVDLSALDIFLQVISKERGAYSSFLQCLDSTNNLISFISNSPELFVKRTGNQLTTSPIKGTISRVRGYLENEQRLHDLVTSTKNKAELAMIVDLFRNDLSKICLPGSVQVSDFPQTLTLQYIHHLYCTVTGQIHDSISDRIAIESLFPSGSITGTPKYTALKTIAELEKRNRGIYCGSFISFSKGGFIANVAIRTATLENKTLTLQAGGGITIDSVELDELTEAEKKLSAFYELLGEQRDQGMFLNPK